MRLDDMWLQTTLNTPNISGVWQIKITNHVKVRVHWQGWFFFIVFCLFEKSAVVYRRNKGTSHSPETGQIPEKT